jgi:Flp pilus assembly protein TadG
MRWAGRPRRDRDEGVVTTFVIIFSVLIIFVIALVVDGGRMLTEHRLAGNLADAAARAGAQAVSEDAVRSGSPIILDEARAESDACAFLDGTGYSCVADAEGNRVEVTVTGSIDLLMLPGGSTTVVGAGNACVAVGITDAAC